MASLDYANAVSSRNDHQAHRSSDGSITYVVAHRDPGIRNWLDTTGLPRGSMVHRFTYPEEPAGENRPTIEGTKVRFDALAQHLPDDVPRYTEEERRSEIAVRQAHVQRRLRQY